MVRILGLRQNNLDITHNACPEQLERYAVLYHFRYHPKYMENGPMKGRPDCHETTRAIVSMNKQAGQNPQIISRINKCRDDLDPEKLNWLISLSQNWKWYFAVNRHADFNPTQGHHRESEKEHASGNREALTHTSDDWWKANWWTKS